MKRWRRAILDVAIEEMGHLVAVWNITSAVGGSPRFGRVNFPIDPGYLPAGIVVKLAPFNDALSAMKTDGTMARIYEKWFGVTPAADSLTLTPLPIPTSAE